MTVTFLIDNIKMGRTGISYPFVLEVPEFGQIAGRVTETQRGATQVAFPSGVKAASTTAGFILYEFHKQVMNADVDSETFVKENLRMRTKVSDFAALNVEACNRYAEADVRGLYEFQKQVNKE